MLNPPSAGGAPNAPALGRAPNAPAVGAAPNAGPGVNAEAGTAPKAEVGLGVRNPEPAGPLPNPQGAGAPNGGAPNVVVGGGRILLKVEGV